MKFTLYDLRGEWANEKDKKIILEQLNKKLEEHITLEDLFYKIGKQWCTVKFIYPNGGKWQLQTIWDEEINADTPGELLQKLLDVVRKRQKEFNEKYIKE